MKKTYIYIAVLSAAMLAGVSCEKIEQPQSPVDNSEIEEKEGTYSVTFECSMAESEGDTKTEFHNNGDGTQGIWWSVGDEINIYQMRYKNDTDLASQVSKQTVPEKDKLDKFSCKITNFTEPSRYPVYYWALFPAGSVKSHRTYFTSDEVVVYYAKMNVPAEQNPTVVSFDPKADVLVSKYITSSEPQTTFNLQFRRVVALGKMRVVNLPSEESIKSIKFENTQSYLAGDGFYELEGTGTRDYVPSETGSKSITVNYPEESQVKANTPTGMTAYFTCRAFTLDKGKKFTVTVTTYAEEVFTKEVTIPEALTGGFRFEEGRATNFTVDMSGGEATVTVGGTTTTYPTISAAFTAANNATGAATIKLMKDCTASTPLTVSNAEADITLNLREYTLTSSGTNRIGISSGKLTIIGEDNGKLTQNSTNSYTIGITGGELVLGSGTVEVKNTSTAQVINVDGGSLTVTGGNVINNGTSSSAVSLASGSATFESGSIISNGGPSLKFAQSSSADLTINGGFFKSGSNDIISDMSTGTIDIEGGYYSKEVADSYLQGQGHSCYLTNEYNDYPYAVLSTGVALFRAGTDKVESKTTINDAIDAANSATGKACTITLVDNCQESGSSAVNVTNSAGVTLDLNGKTLNLTSGAYLRVSEGGKMIIDDNDKENLGVVTTDGYNYAIVAIKGDLTIKGGTIKSTYSSSNVVAAVGSTQSNTTSITIEGGSLTAPSGSGYGLYVNNSNCTVYVEEGGQISSDVNNSIRIMSGNLMISGGKIVARGASKYALEIGSGLSATNSITISGGQLISEQYSTVHVYAKDGTISITGNAYFYSGETSTEPAIFRYSTNTIKVSASAYGYFGSASESFDKSKVDVQIDGAYHVGNIGNHVNYDGYTYKCKMYSGAQ